jgi:hypothetical protein
MKPAAEIHLSIGEDEAGTQRSLGTSCESFGRDFETKHLQKSTESLKQ